MNITDVDDKILNRARETNVSPLELARRYEAEFWEVDSFDALTAQRGKKDIASARVASSGILPTTSATGGPASLGHDHGEVDTRAGRLLGVAVAQS